MYKRMYVGLKNKNKNTKIKTEFNNKHILILMVLGYKD